MGSRISRPSSSSPTSGPPHLPFDIYVEVLDHLRPSLAEDRKTLRALALCCRTLRGASQRVLFSSMRYGLLDINSNRIVHIIKVHSKFLRAIADSPDRLALYVLSYSQQSLALDPKLYAQGRYCFSCILHVSCLPMLPAKALTLTHKKPRARLWALTEMVLPLMVNLKTLKFRPFVYHPSAPMILRKCTFQLESLTWMGIGSEETLYSSFLPTQRSLLHLNINSDIYNDRPALPDGLCPFLKSVSCSLSDLARISAMRPVTILHVANSSADISRPPRNVSAAEREWCVAALRKIKYLRLWNLLQFQQFTSSIMFPEVTVLQLRVWPLEARTTPLPCPLLICSDALPQDTNLLIQFPNLRSLRLYNHHQSDINASTHHDTALRAFTRCPGLQSVLIIETVPPAGLVWQFSALCNGEIDKAMTSMDHYLDPMWWKI
jgi:hypothetical protein